MVDRKSGKVGSLLGSVFHAVVIGAIGLGCAWVYLYTTGSPIVPLILGQPTGMSELEREGYDGPPEGVPVETEPSEAEIEHAMRGLWDCFYAPTMNDYWHDDVYCTNGVDSERPILLEGQFVTQADMEAAAAEYEAQLNVR